MRNSTQSKAVAAKKERIRKALSVSDVILAFHKSKIVDNGTYLTRANKQRGSVELYLMNDAHNLELIAVKGKTESIMGAYVMVVINPDFKDFNLLKLVVDGCSNRERIFVSKGLQEIKRDTFSELELSRIANGVN